MNGLGIAQSAGAAPLFTTRTGIFIIACLIAIGAVLCVVLP
jgi:hypothetical protein